MFLHLGQTFQKCFLLIFKYEHDISNGSQKKIE